VTNPLQLRGPLGQFDEGEIDVNGQSLIRTFQFNPVTVGYLDAISSDTYDAELPITLIQPLNLFSGTINGYFPHAVEFGLGRGKTFFEGGRIRVVDPVVLAIGGITDFGTFPNLTLHDPADFYCASSTAGTSGAVGAAWTRHNAVFAVSRGEKFSRVAYVGLASKITSQPAGTNQYLGAVQLERAPLDGGSYPTAYTQAREVQTFVKPDRLNYSVNPGFEVDTSNWAASTGGTLTRVDSPIAKGLWSGQVAITSNSTVMITHTIPNLVIGRQYTTTVYVRAISRPDVAISALSATVQYARGYAASDDIQDANNFRRLAITYIALAPTVMLVLTPVAVSGTPNVIVDACLVERGAVERPYFTGGIGADYLWETGGTPGICRSYYYKNRAERFAAIKRILALNVPLGIGYADPVFATLPVE
jgi:hypothetical protein